MSTHSEVDLQNILRKLINYETIVYLNCTLIVVNQLVESSLAHGKRYAVLILRCDKTSNFFKQHEVIAFAVVTVIIFKVKAVAKREYSRAPYTTLLSSLQRHRISSPLLDRFPSSFTRPRYFWLADGDA